MATASTPRKRRERRFRSGGAAVAVARTRVGLSQRSLAERVGVHPSLIAQFEAGWCSVSAEVLEAIAAELDVPVAILVERESA